MANWQVGEGFRTNKYNKEDSGLQIEYIVLLFFQQRPNYLLQGNVVAVSVVNDVHGSR